LRPLELPPQSLLTAAVLDRLGEVRYFDVLAAVEVGDGARHLADALVGAGTETQALDGSSQQRLAGLGELAVGADLLAGQRGVGDGDGEVRSPGSEVRGAGLVVGIGGRAAAATVPLNLLP